MKTLVSTLFVFFIFTSVLAQQQYPVLENAVETADREAKLQRTKEIERELDKIERSIDRNLKVVRNREADVRSYERELSFAQEQQQRAESSANSLRAEIRGHDLDALKDEVDRLDRDQRKLERVNHKAERAIVRKKAKIERLLNEIGIMDNTIVDNGHRIEEKESEKAAAQNEIVAYGLVSKNERIRELDNERASLESKKKRIERKKGRAQDEIYASESENEAMQIQRRNLMMELDQLLSFFN